MANSPSYDERKKRGPTFYSIIGNVMNLHIGISPCPNDTFQFEGLYNHQIETNNVHFTFDFQDVETLNNQAALQHYDVLKISYARYFSVQQNYILLRSGSALGFGVGPLLITKQAENVDTIMTGKVALPGKETTAHFLFNRAYPNHPNKVFMRFNDIEQAVLSGEVLAGVIIHENRFTYHQRGLHKIVDLGAYWEQETGLPIPLGGIAIKRSFPPSLQHQLQQWMAQSVQLAFNKTNQGLSDFVKLHAQEMAPDVMQQHIDLYVNEESKYISEKGMQAVRAMGQFLGATETNPWWVPA
jgi:1,4-dihydroxy-6-naphthoate synthase